MFNTIYPNVYRILRKRTGLSQDDFGEALGATRYTVSKFETGRLFPDENQERRILELANCSQIDFVELVSEQLSQLIEKPVGLLKDHGAYEPTTALAKANDLLGKSSLKIQPVMARALQKRIRTTRALSFVFELNYEELVELTEYCHEASASAAGMGPS